MVQLQCCIPPRASRLCSWIATSVIFCLHYTDKWAYMVIVRCSASVNCASKAGLCHTGRSSRSCSTLLAKAGNCIHAQPTSRRWVESQRD